MVGRYGGSVRRCWLALLVGLVFVANPAAILACTCVPFTKPELVGNASVIFTGTVTGSSRGSPFGLGCTASTVSTADPILVTFQVESVYKGHASAQVTVSTVAGESSCGYSFQSGKRYTVFATGTLDKPETNLCRGNVEGAISPTEYGLGPGRPPD